MRTRIDERQQPVERFPKVRYRNRILDRERRYLSECMNPGIRSARAGNLHHTPFDAAQDVSRVP